MKESEGEIRWEFNFQENKKRAYEISVSPCICFGSGGWIRTNDLRVMRTEDVVSLLILVHT